MRTIKAYEMLCTRWVKLMEILLPFSSYFEGFWTAKLGSGRVFLKLLLPSGHEIMLKTYVPVGLTYMHAGSRTINQKRFNKV